MADHTLIARHPNRALFVCWPPRPGDTGVIEILERYRPETVALVTWPLADTGRAADFYPRPRTGLGADQDNQASPRGDTHR